MRTIVLALSTVLAASLLSASTAFANDADKAACVSKAQGDPCVRSNADPGVCVPDQTDPSVLSCEDTGAAGSGGSSGGGGSGASSGSAGDGGSGASSGTGGSQNTAACVGKSNGDACVRAGGQPGTCKPDSSDPSVLECDDDNASAGGGSADDGCAFTGRSASPQGWMALSLAALALAMRKRQHP